MAVCAGVAYALGRYFSPTEFNTLHACYLNSSQVEFADLGLGATSLQKFWLVMSTASQTNGWRSHYFVRVATLEVEKNI
jgi:hypothetical protein